MKVTVTKRHIKEGQPDNPHSCAIALAVEETINKELKKMAQKCKHPLSKFVFLELDEIDVDSDNVTVSINGERKTMRATKHISAFVDAFDTQGDEEPQPEDFDDKTAFKLAHKEWKKKRNILKPFSFDLKLV